MTQPGALNNILPESEDWIARKLAELQRQVTQLSTAIPANALMVGSYNGRTDNQSLTSAGTYLHRGSIDVPDGYRRAIVHCVISVGATNNSTSDGYVFGSAVITHPTDITGPDGDGASSPVGRGGGAGSITFATTRVIENLTTDPIGLGAFGSVLPSPASWAGGNGHISAFAVFLR